MSQSFVEFLKKKKNILVLGGVDNTTILNAEKQMGIQFADDYKKYLKECGAVSFDNHEITGLCSSKRLNVVCVTDYLRKNIPHIPDDLYVIEQLDIDGIVIWQDQQGTIFQSNGVYSIDRVGDNLASYYAAQTQ